MRTKQIVSGTAALALSALLFTACNNENDPTHAISSKYVTIVPTVTGEVITKASSSYGQTGNQLYLYYNTAGNTATGQYADFRYDGAIWDLGADKMKWATIHAAATGSIPFYATAPVAAPTTAKVETNQSTADKYKNSDLLVAYTSIAKAASDDKYTALSLDLKHALAKLTIEVNATAIDNPVIKSVTIKDAIADYTVTYKTKNTDKERGVYSFCMCPGGYVVNASSENGRTCVNGMSFSGRDSHNANSAIIVTVGPDDFGHEVLDGIKFQRQLEANAYAEGNGKVPVQLFGDFEKNITTTKLGEVEPCIKGEYTFANLKNVLPSYVADSVVEGVHGFSKFIHDFDRKDAVLSGVESRTSSPVRIIRNDELVSTSVCGLYPCGEGAGYAGGITSAAVDGVKVAEYMAVTSACMG